VFFRGTDVTARYTQWVSGETPVPMFTSAQAWDALRMYVTQNRLYAHFSVALHMVTSMMYQYLPDTMEAVAWLDNCWEVVIPEFHSMRGRFPFFNTGEPAFLTQRPLNEWAFIGNQLERLHLTALLFGQAIYAGIAVRGLRTCFEMDPQDVRSSEENFYRPDAFVSSAAAEFVRRHVPMPGLPGVTYWLGDRLDRVRAGVVIPTNKPASANPPDTIHRYEVVVTEQEVTEEVRENPNNWPANREGKAAAILDVARKKRGATVMREDFPDCPLPLDFELALRDLTIATRVRRAAVRMWGVAVKLLPMPGYPTFLCPTQTLPYPSPFDEAGVIDKSIGEMYHNGVFMKSQEAWRVVQALAWAGNTTTYAARNPTLDNREFVRGRYSGQVWPLLFTPEDNHGSVRVADQHMADDNAICLPVVTNRSLGDTKVAYKYVRRWHSVAAGQGVDERKINEVGASVPFSSQKVTTQIQMSAGFKEARGYVDRTATDFLIAPDVTVGVVPPRQPQGGATNVDGSSEAGGNNQ
jgi:hypothetical protein